MGVSVFGQGLVIVVYHITVSVCFLDNSFHFLWKNCPLIKFSRSKKKKLSELNNNPQSAKNDVQSASDGVASCEKAIQNKKGKYDPAVHVRNNEVFVLSEVAFIAINHLT
jgi:peptidoglycan hydrolase CwlO-like protein